MLPKLRRSNVTYHHVGHNPTARFDKGGALEGSVVILAGSGLVTLGTFLSNVGRRVVIDWLWILAAIAVGVGALWGLSMVGGFGGNSGRSGWWGVLILPYPIGSVIGITSLLFRSVRSVRCHHAGAPSAE